MKNIKILIHEIHRRSLWQVLGIYVVGSCLVLQAVDTLAGPSTFPIGPHPSTVGKQHRGDP